MAIPDFQSLMLPVLQFSATSEAQIGDVIETLGDKFALTNEERSALLPSGRQTTFANRVHWAKSYLGKAGLIESTGRGQFRITEEGKSVLSVPPKRIDIKFLEKFPQFRTFRQATRSENDEKRNEAATSQREVLTPDDAMRAAQRRARVGIGTRPSRTHRCFIACVFRAACRQASDGDGLWGLDCERRSRAWEKWRWGRRRRHRSGSARARPDLCPSEEVWRKRCKRGSHSRFFRSARSVQGGKGPVHDDLHVLRGGTSDGQGHEQANSC